MALADIKPAGYNPREISDKAKSGLAASIERFGLVEPIVYNERTGSVVGGHQRLAVLLDAGEKSTQVVVVDLPLEEEKALNIALNNRHIAGEFTADVAGIIAELRDLLPDVVEDLRLDEILTDLPAVEAELGEPGGELEYSRQYSVAVICGDEVEQQDVYDKLMAMGYSNLRLLSI